MRGAAGRRGGEENRIMARHFQCSFYMRHVPIYDSRRDYCHISLADICILTFTFDRKALLELNLKHVPKGLDVKPPTRAVAEHVYAEP